MSSESTQMIGPTHLERRILHRFFIDKDGGPDHELPGVGVFDSQIHKVFDSERIGGSIFGPYEVDLALGRLVRRRVLMVHFKMETGRSYRLTPDAMRSDDLIDFSNSCEIDKDSPPPAEETGPRLIPADTRESIKAKLEQFHKYFVDECTVFHRAEQTWRDLLLDLTQPGRMVTPHLLAARAMEWQEANRSLEAAQLRVQRCAELIELL